MEIISANTTWASGTITLTSEVQIAAGATLTVDPGVVIIGNNNSIEAIGSLNVAGVRGDNVQIEDTNIVLSPNSTTPGAISINDAVLSGGSFLAPTGNGSYGFWSLTNSTLSGLPAIYVWYPTGNVLVEGDYFENSGGLSIGTSGGQVKVNDNTFSGWISNLLSSAAIEDWASYNSSQTTITDNNFLNAGKIALELVPGYTSAAMTASGNYYGTTDSNVIASMIYDQHNDLNSAGIIPNLNVQSAFVSAAPSSPEPGPTTSAPASPPTSPPSSPDSSPPSPPPTFTGQDMTTGQSLTGYGSGFSDITPDNLVITTQASNAFIVSGTGDDIIRASGSGTNVLDDTGGTVNFEIGSTSGHNAFFLDASKDPVTWNTVANLKAGDFAVIYGIGPQNLQINAANDLGVSGYTGLTLETYQNGGAGFITFAGYSKADLGSSLATAFGTDQSGRSFLLVVGA